MIKLLTWEIILQVKPLVAKILLQLSFLSVADKWVKEIEIIGGLWQHIEKSISRSVSYSPFILR